MEYKIEFQSPDRLVISKSMPAAEAMSLCKHMREHFGRSVRIDILEKESKKCWVKSDLMKVETLGN
jgi:hypothetical protein